MNWLIVLNNAELIEYKQIDNPEELEARAFYYANCVDSEGHCRFSVFTAKHIPPTVNANYIGHQP